MFQPVSSYTGWPFWWPKTVHLHIFVCLLFLVLFSGAKLIFHTGCKHLPHTSFTHCVFQTKISPGGVVCLFFLVIGDSFWSCCCSSRNFNHCIRIRQSIFIQTSGCHPPSLWLTRKQRRLFDVADITLSLWCILIRHQLHLWLLVPLGYCSTGLTLCLPAMFFNQEWYDCHIMSITVTCYWCEEAIRINEARLSIDIPSLIQ
jgi:hypothetical protein